MIGVIIVWGITVALRILISAIPGLILSFIIICIIKCIIKKIIKDKYYRRLIYAIIIIICSYISIILMFPSVMKLYYGTEKASDLYIEMTKLNNNRSLIGLSKDEITDLLGKPKEEYKDSYEYSAGKIYKDGLMVRDTHYYRLVVFFDENDRVRATWIKEVA